MPLPTSTEPRCFRQHLRVWSAGVCVALACGAVIGAQNATNAQGGVQTPSARCRISGRLTSGTTPLPGASIIVSLDNTPRAITSSDIDGTYVVTGTKHVPHTLVLSGRP